VLAVLSALARCHSQGFTYGDIKPANLLLKHQYPDPPHLTRCPP
jgi:serine/threonine protein kinase